MIGAFGRLLALGLLAALIGCGGGDDDDNGRPGPGTADAGDNSQDVVWDCTCTAFCDFEEETVAFEGCGDEGDAEAAVQEIVDECVTELEAEACGEAECECECEPTELAC